jgi:hypothetical protein
LRLHDLIVRDFTNLYPYITLSKENREHIKNRLALPDTLQLTKYSDGIRRLFLQIEALFVFSILKSTITSQLGRDTWVRKVLRHHDIPLDAPALTYFVPPVKGKSSYGPELATFDIREVKQSLCTSSLLLTRPSFLQL